jgi:SRSO17 transposase
MSSLCTLPETQGKRFAAYLERLSTALGHADRKIPFKNYCTALLLPGERKSVEAMATRVAPTQVKRLHQALHHFIAKAPWSDAALLTQVRNCVLPVMEKKEPIAAWLVQEMVFPKKGTHSAGVLRQEGEEAMKAQNCEVAVSLWVASGWSSLPIAWRLYLPTTWAWDQGRRRAAGVPDAVKYQRKSQMALEQIRQAVKAGVARGVVIAGAGQGTDHGFRSALSKWGLQYLVGVQSSTRVLVANALFMPGEVKKNKSRPSGLLCGEETLRPLLAEELARALRPLAWQGISWREGGGETRGSHFAALRVHPAGGQGGNGRLPPEVWLLIDWPRGEAQPRQYWLSNLPSHIPLAGLVQQVKRGWMIRQDCRELKEELGLGHYEGRGWRGIHHHATLCIAAYGFLVAERSSWYPWARAGGVELPAPAVGGPSGLHGSLAAAA